MHSPSRGPAHFPCHPLRICYEQPSLQVSGKLLEFGVRRRFWALMSPGVLSAQRHDGGRWDFRL